MKLWQYLTTVALGLACVGLSVAIVMTANSNLATQEKIQARQQQLNNSVLGQQAQQITGNILQDMAATASKNTKMRDLLSKYGYTVPAAKAPAVTEPTPVKKTTPAKTDKED